MLTTPDFIQANWFMAEYIALFFAGLLGGVHCVGMCGGIVGALSLNTSAHSKTAKASILLGYNLGRISSYVLVGTLIGALGALISSSDIQSIQSLLKIIAALFMIAFGLYIANFWMGLLKFEKLGQSTWRYIEPFSRRFIPVQHFGHALPLGFLWGWLPCGMVYSALIMAFAAGNAWQGAGLMLAFGLGTLPNLLLMGVMASTLKRFTQNRIVKQLAGLLVVLMGVFMLSNSL